MHIQYAKLISALRVAVGTSDMGGQGPGQRGGGVGVALCRTKGCESMEKWGRVGESSSLGRVGQQQLRRHAAELLSMMNSVCDGLWLTSLLWYFFCFLERHPCFYGVVFFKVACRWFRVGAAVWQRACPRVSVRLCLWACMTAVCLPDLPRVTCS